MKRIEERRVRGRRRGKSRPVTTTGTRTNYLPTKLALWPVLVCCIFVFCFSFFWFRWAMYITSTVLLLNFSSSLPGSLACTTRRRVTGTILESARAVVGVSRQVRSSHKWPLPSSPSSSSSSSESVQIPNHTLVLLAFLRPPFALSPSSHFHRRHPFHFPHPST